MISAANDLCGFDDGGAFCVLPEIRCSMVDGVFVASVVGIFWFAELLGSGLDVRAKLVS